MESLFEDNKNEDFVKWTESKDLISSGVLFKYSSVDGEDAQMVASVCEKKGRRHTLETLWSRWQKLTEEDDLGKWRLPTLSGLVGYSLS